MEEKKKNIFFDCIAHKISLSPDSKAFKKLGASEDGEENSA